MLLEHGSIKALTCEQKLNFFLDNGVEELYWYNHFTIPPLNL